VIPESPLETYLAGQAAIVGTVVRALDDAIRHAHPELDVAIKYKMLMYTVGKDWRTWVCAIGTTSHLVCLRFLYGVLLDDPQRVLRAGTSVLKTWDFAFADTVDPVAVGAYVTDAVARRDDYKARSKEVRAAAKG
jgi:hypothetical protein